MRRYRSGFTLIELAVVLLIIAISVTVVFPKLDGGLLKRVRFRSSAKRLASVAEYAHQRAAYTQLTHLLHLDTEKGTYWVTAETADGRAATTIDGLGLKGRLPEGVQFASVEIPGMKTSSQDVVTVEFSPQGWADPATIHVVSSSGQAISIAIDELSGCVEMCALVE